MPTTISCPDAATLCGGTVQWFDSGLAPVRGDATCADHADCSSRGSCVGGACRCVMLSTGALCDENIYDSEDLTAHAKGEADGHGGYDGAYGEPGSTAGYGSPAPLPTPLPTLPPPPPPSSPPPLPLAQPTQSPGDSPSPPPPTAQPAPAGTPSPPPPPPMIVIPTGPSGDPDAGPTSPPPPGAVPLPLDEASYVVVTNAWSDCQPVSGARRSVCEYVCS